MYTNEILPQSPYYDPEHAASSTPLLNQPQTATSPTSQRWTVKLFASIFISSVLVVSIFLLNVNQVQEPHGGRLGEDGDKNRKVAPEILTPPSRGWSQGVSEKAFREGKVGQLGYPWTKSMLSWQRTSYHFQPEKNWMNDPNGPLFHMGWYHFFYQYNPDAAIWGNITWGHAVSTDLINWLHLPISMVPDSSFDINGVWTGSATILPDGQIVMLYTGATEQLVQVQNLAYPKNLSDPLLVEWVKYSNNPVIVPPPGIGLQDFRDPTTAWVGPNGNWLISIGSKINKDKVGIALVYETTDFTSFKLLDGILHGVPGTGMWECVDLYPISTVDSNGLDTSANGPNIKHVLKASMDDNRHDYYAIGTYDPINNKWTPDNAEMDVGIGLRLDYGTFYASKSFYDQHKHRRVLWGWTSESDSEIDDLLKGWASLQTIPRTIVFDKKTGTNLLQWPVEEIESLRSGLTEFNDVKLEPGSIVPLKVDSTSQVDIVATFKVDEEAFKTNMDNIVGYTCGSSGGSVSRGSLGPFGLVVLAEEKLTELTPIYFYIAKGIGGKPEVHFCADELRSSVAFEVGREIFGSRVPVLEGEDFTMRVLVDHSIVESYAQGGRTVITSRIYPTKAIYGAAQIFLFNNATTTSVTASVKIYNMGSANIRNFPLN